MDSITKDEIEKMNLLAIATAKAATLAKNKAIRLTEGALSYWVFDVNGFKYIGYYVGHADSPQTDFFKTKTTFTTKTASGDNIEMQRLA